MSELAASGGILARGHSSIRDRRAEIVIGRLQDVDAAGYERTLGGVLHQLIVGQ